MDKRSYEIFFRSFSESPFLVVVPELALVPRPAQAANFVWAAVLGLAVDSPRAEGRCRPQSLLLSPSRVI